mmetsp:Transcript_25713/g.72037  ORF Transcript_25713/g.72037 Transcript_25713/m.72037 type:complete len:219 (-) Transcript_25713:230-886(-)
MQGEVELPGHRTDEQRLGGPNPRGSAGSLVEFPRVSAMARIQHVPAKGVLHEPQPHEVGVSRVGALHHVPRELVRGARGGPQLGGPQRTVEAQRRPVRGAAEGYATPGHLQFRSRHGHDFPGLGVHVHHDFTPSEHPGDEMPFPPLLQAPGGHGLERLVDEEAEARLLRLVDEERPAPLARARGGQEVVALVLGDSHPHAYGHSLGGASGDILHGDVP